MNTQALLIVLLVVAVVFGLGVVLLNRRRGSGATTLEPTVASKPTVLEPAPPPRVEPEIIEPVVAEVERPPTFRERMGKAAAVMAGALGGVRARAGITDDTWDDLEEALLRADLGLGITNSLLDPLRERVRAKELTDPNDLIDALRADMKSRLAVADRSLTFDDALRSQDLVNVWLVVGVNGVGKTTTIGKISAQQTALGRSLVLAAGDTFRAAAAEQLGTWAER